MLATWIELEHCYAASFATVDDVTQMLATWIELEHCYAASFATVDDVHKCLPLGLS